MKYRYLALFLILLVSILVVVFLLPSTQIELQLIPSLYTLKVKHSHSLLFERYLQEKKITHYSIYNQKLPINDYAFTKTVSLNSIFESTSTLDEPQYQFLTNLKNLFSDSSWSYFYIDANRSPISYYLKFKKKFREPFTFSLCGFSVVQFFYTFLLSLVFYGMIWYFFCRYRIWCYIGFPLNLVLVYKGSFFILLSHYVIWGGILFYFFCELDKWKKSLRLTNLLPKTEFKKVAYLLLWLILPITIFFLFINSPPFSFLLLFLIISYHLVGGAFYFFLVYTKERGVGFGGFLIEPILNYNKKQKVNLLQFSFFFLFLVLFSLGIFFTLSSSTLCYAPKYSQTISLSNKNKIQKFLARQSLNDSNLIHGAFYCLYCNYQDFKLEGISYQKIIDSIVSGKDIVWQNDVELSESQSLSLEYNFVSPDVILSSWPTIANNSSFNGLLFLNKKMVGLSQDKNILLIRKFVLLGSALFITFLNLLFLYFFLHPFTILCYKSRSFYKEFVLR